MQTNTIIFKKKIIKTKFINFKSNFYLIFSQNLLNLTIYRWKGQLMLMNRVYIMSKPKPNKSIKI